MLDQPANGDDVVSEEIVLRGNGPYSLKNAQQAKAVAQGDLVRVSLRVQADLGALPHWVHVKMTAAVAEQLKGALNDAIKPQARTDQAGTLGDA